MDASVRRCFLEVHVDGCEEPRLLQLDPAVKFHNVLDRFEDAGDLYWGEQRIDPDTTPAALGMRCGVDEAHALWFVTAAPQPVPRAASHYRASAAANAQGHVRRGASSLPAYSTEGAAGAPPAAALYSRPRLLSPALPAPGAAAAFSTPTRRPSPAPRPNARAAPAVVDDRVRRHRLFAAPAPPPLPPPPPPHTTAPTRRNAPILMDPELLVDGLGAAVGSPQPRGSPSRGAWRADSQAAAAAEAIRHVVVRLPSVAAAATEPSVEQLAMDLHDKQMHRLYQQRRLYLTHDPRL
ncbi:hypothetical protein NESM_000020500 [Novymonas esmeraldas]|uniref:Uncharacterized protein n=1 Tax=Novymonas esmeraldas TaxID=1808958 RepID=A0AAW0F2A3_9TRYP